MRIAIPCYCCKLHFSEPLTEYSNLFELFVDICGVTEGLTLQFYLKTPGTEISYKLILKS